jgi:preprotein translocase subunit SecG
MFWTNTAITILLIVYVIDCAFMGLVIMMQRSKQEGLGAAFGGGFTESVWGAQTSQVLVKATVWATIIFFVLSICLARLYSYRGSLNEKGSVVQQELSKPVAPAITNTAPMTPAVPAATPKSTPATPAPVAPAPTPTNASAQAAPTATTPAKPASK